MQTVRHQSRPDSDIAQNVRGADAQITAVDQHPARLLEKELRRRQMLQYRIAEDKVGRLVFDRPILVGRQLAKFIDGWVGLPGAIHIQTDDLGDSSLETLQAAPNAHRIFGVLAPATSEVHQHERWLDQRIDPGIECDRPFGLGEAAKVALGIKTFDVFIHGLIQGASACGPPTCKAVWPAGKHALESNRPSAEANERRLDFRLPDYRGEGQLRSKTSPLATETKSRKLEKER